MCNSSKQSKQCQVYINTAFEYELFQHAIKKDEVCDSKNLHCLCNFKFSSNILIYRECPYKNTWTNNSAKENIWICRYCSHSVYF